jgi:hypothetical protein
MAEKKTERWDNAHDTPLPEPDQLCIPGFWYVVLMPRRAPDKIGSIILSDNSKWSEEWLNYCGQVVALGPLAYRHAKYRDMGLTEDQAPKRGEFWLYKPYSPYRMEYKGNKFIALSDDSLIARLPPNVNPWDFRAGV